MRSLKALTFLVGLKKSTEKENQTKKIYIFSLSYIFCNVFQLRKVQICIIDFIKFIQNNLIFSLLYFNL